MHSCAMTAMIWWCALDISGWITWENSGAMCSSTTRSRGKRMLVYGPTMLAALEYIAMLYGVVYRGERALLCACGGRDSTSYTQRIGERTIRLERKNGMMRAFLDGKAIYTGACGQCVEISMQGEVLSVKPIP